LLVLAFFGTCQPQIESIVLIARHAESEPEQQFLCGLIMLNGPLIRVPDPALSLLPGVIHRK
jgi:hypothetical protein